MTVSSPIEVGQEFEALVVFTDYARFTAISKKRGLGATANFLEQSAEITFDVVSAAGGTVVKYIGDASLIVFGAEQVDAGVAALIDLVATIGIDSRLNASAHFGLVRGVSLRGIEMPDVLGQAVNIAASVP
jgi:class 3 adenylate cyclase